MNYAKTILLTIAMGSFSVAMHAMAAVASKPAAIGGYHFSCCCPEESALLVKRLPRMQQAISKLLHEYCKPQTTPEEPAFVAEREKSESAEVEEIPLHELPNIGVTVSGGGWVAAIAELGLLRGLQEIGLLDGVASIATSSGSTWMLSTWLKLSELEDACVNFDKVEAYLRPRLERGFRVDKGTISDWVGTFQEQHRMDVTSMWGELLADQFLDPDNNRYVAHYLHDSSHVVSSGDFPLPLFTSIIKPEVSTLQWAKSLVNTTPKVENSYLEYSPFITRLNGERTPYIKTENIGVTWNYLLGTWGSAYGGTAGDVAVLVQEAITGLFGWKSKIAACFSCCTVTNPFSPTMPNFLKETETPFKGQKSLRPIDSGIALKVPFPPLFDRKTQIIIACDVSSDSSYGNGTHSLEQTAEYAKNHGIPFPQLNHDTVLNDENVDVIIDRENARAPIVIYFKGAAAEMKPQNSHKEFSAIHDDMYNKVVKAKKKILDAIAAHLTRV